ncbi:MAG: T9SS type A sorting domain-containing protein, partial [Candidatus Kapaibacterium sp.]
GGSARLSLFDTTGREIAVVFEQQLGIGRHAVPYSVATLPSGTYYWRLQTASHIETSPMVVMH